MKTLRTISLLTLMLLGMATLSAQQKYDIRMKVPAGFKMTTKTVVKSPYTVNIGSQGMKTDMTATNEVMTTCDAVKDGKFDFTSTITLMDVELSMMGMTQRISSKDAPSDKNKQLIAIVNKPIKFTTDDLCRIQGDAKADDLAKAMDQIVPGQGSEMVKQLSRNLMVGFYPGKPVALNEEFPFAITQGTLGAETHITGTGKLVKVTDTEYVIDYKVKCKGEIQGNNIAGDGTVSYAVDRKTGVFKNAVTKLAMSGNIDVQGQSGSLTMDMESTSTNTF